MHSYNVNMDRLKEVAQENGWTFNPDGQRVKRVIAKMTDNYELYGDYYCPDQLISSPPICGMDVLCPCSKASYEITARGRCSCRLFYAVEETVCAETGPQAKQDPSSVLS
ncbi:ferredoxin-thioredoxin reductase catalytic domain-containing protein [Planctomycetota bacterium]